MIQLVAVADWQGGIFSWRRVLRPPRRGGDALVFHQTLVYADQGRRRAFFTEKALHDADLNAAREIPHSGTEGSRGPRRFIEYRCVVGPCGRVHDP